MYNRKGGGWNKGLNKETSEGVMKMAKTLSEKLKGTKKSPLTVEQKKNLSLKRIKFLEENPDCNIKWYEVHNGKRLVKVQGKWEKDVADWLNKQNVKWERNRICYDGAHHYIPDFWLIEHDFYIEVKGWLRDRDIKKMKRVIELTGIEIRLLDKTLYEKLNSINIHDLAPWRNW